MIPRILHRVVPEHTSPEVEDYWRRFAEMHPGWELRTWRDPLDPSDFELGDLFGRCRSGAQLADLVRLEVLFRHGGIYVDSDCEPWRSLEPLRVLGFFIGTENGKLLTNAVLGAEPGHPALRACIDTVVAERRVDLHAQAHEATGPFLVSAVLGDRHDVTVLPPECFYPYKGRRPADPAGVATRHTYVVHHWAGSWLEQARVDPATVRARAGRASVRARVGASAVARSAVAAGLRLLPERAEGVKATSFGDGRMLVRRPDGRPLLAPVSAGVTARLAVDGYGDRPAWVLPGWLLQHGQVAVEVGAGFGLRTTRMAGVVERFGRVYAFEADASDRDLLHENLVVNGFADRVRVSDAEDPTAFISGLPAPVPVHLLWIDRAALVDATEPASALIASGRVAHLVVEVDRRLHLPAWARVAAFLRQAGSGGATVRVIDADGRAHPSSADRVLACAGTLVVHVSNPGG